MKCPICGGELIWQSDSMACEVYSQYDYDEEAMVQFYKFSKCGRDIEITDPTKEERETDYSSYWRPDIK